MLSCISPAPPGATTNPARGDMHQQKTDSRDKTGYKRKGATKARGPETGFISRRPDFEKYMFYTAMLVQNRIED